MGRYSSVVAALIVRIQSHLGAGNILEGFRFVDVPVEDVEGTKNFPTVRLYLPEPADGDHVNLIDGDLTLKVLVSTHKHKGLIEHMAAVEKVLDAASLKNDLTQDCSLEGTLAAPMRCTVRESFIEGISLNSQLYLLCSPNPCTKGSERL